MAKNVSPTNFRDLSGQVINGVRVIARNPVNGSRGQVRYDCECHCGKKFTTRSGNLKDKGTKSCGCLQRLAAAKNGKACAKAETAQNNVLIAYKKRCKDKGLQWNLTNEEAIFLFKGDCFYCGAPPSSIQKARSGTYVYNGIDRVDSSAGYAIANCVSCCSTCNYAKNDLTVLEFKNWVERISSFWLGK